LQFGEGEKNLKIYCCNPSEKKELIPSFCGSWAGCTTHTCPNYQKCPSSIAINSQKNSYLAKDFIMSHFFAIYIVYKEKYFYFNNEVREWRENCTQARQMLKDGCCNA
jgi:hypothetical protein